MCKILLFGLSILSVTLFTGCHPYKKQIPTGPGKQVQNVYSNPNIDHSKILNVLLLPVGNPLEMRQISTQERGIILNILRNFGKFHYFNLQTIDKSKIEPDEIINLETGEIDRFKVGDLGKNYHAQAILKVSLQELRTFMPLRMKIKAALIDTESGERIWAVDDVFDTEDANVVNAMRIWWNTRIAGGDSIEHFEASMVSPGFFMNFVLYELARSYSEMRIENVKAIAREKARIFKEQDRIEQLREDAIR
jgi:hypothetical protein